MDFVEAAYCDKYFPIKKITLYFSLCQTLYGILAGGSFPMKIPIPNRTKNHSFFFTYCRKRSAALDDALKNGILVVSQEEPNPDRFSRASCRQYCAKSLENTNGYSLRNFTCLVGKLLRENCEAPLSKKFC